MLRPARSSANVGSKPLASRLRSSRAASSPGAAPSAHGSTTASARPSGTTSLHGAGARNWRAAALVRRRRRRDLGVLRAAYHGQRRWPRHRSPWPLRKARLERSYRNRRGEVSTGEAAHALRGWCRRATCVVIGSAGANHHVFKAHELAHADTARRPGDGHTARVDRCLAECAVAWAKERGAGDSVGARPWGPPSDSPPKRGRRC